MTIAYRHCFLIVFFLISSTQARTQSRGGIYDLQGDWMVYEKDHYTSFSEKDFGHVSTVYFLLKDDQHKGDFLKVQSVYELSLFINGKVAINSEKPDLLLRIDSLRDVFHANTLQVAIHQRRIHPETLLAEIVSDRPRTSSSQDEEILKPATYFRDFVLTASLILLVMLVIVIRLNAKLAADYFSVTRIFSLRESDDSQLYGRITSSSNILFYSYCSLVVSFYLMIIFHFVPARFQVSWPFQTDSFLTSLWQWLRLSVILFTVFFGKIMLIYVFTRLFALQEIFGLHVFNWIRLMLILFGLLSSIVVIYHITHGYSEKVYAAFLWCVAWISLLWLMIIFPKVMRRSNFSLFHIFSYICATEIIPVLISIKIIYN